MIGKGPSESLIDAGNVGVGYSERAPLATDLSYRRETRRILASPIAVRLFFDDHSDDESHHFLDFCSLCKKHLEGNGDIYMYRGDTPFCSQECRQEQMEMDEGREKNWKLAMMEHQQKHKKSSSSAKSQKIRVQLGTVALA